MHAIKCSLQQVNGKDMFTAHWRLKAVSRNQTAVTATKLSENIKIVAQNVKGRYR